MVDKDYDGEISPGGETEREKRAGHLEMNEVPVSCGRQETSNSCADGHCEEGSMILIFKVLKV